MDNTDDDGWKQHEIHKKLVEKTDDDPKTVIGNDVLVPCNISFPFGLKKMYVKGKVEIVYPKEVYVHVKFCGMKRFFLIDDIHAIEDRESLLVVETFVDDGNSLKDEPGAVASKPKKLIGAKRKASNNIIEYTRKSKTQRKEGEQDNSLRRSSRKSPKNKKYIEGDS